MTIQEVTYRVDHDKIKQEVLEQKREDQQISIYSISTTTKGYWVARLEYVGGKFDLFEGHGDKIDVVRHFDPKDHVYPPVGNFDAMQERARLAVESYRNAPKYKPGEEPPATE